MMHTNLRMHKQEKEKGLLLTMENLNSVIALGLY